MASQKLLDHLARCGVAALTPLLTPPTLDLVEKVSKAAFNPEGLAFLAISIFGELGILRKKSIRDLIFVNLHPDEGRALCHFLILPVAAPALTLAGAKFDSDPKNLELLARWFDVAYTGDEYLQADFETSRKAGAANKLRAHQLAGFYKLRGLISTPGERSLVQMPFGSGKLRLVASAVLDLFRSHANGKTILWLAPGEALCEEAFDELRHVWDHLGSRDIPIFRAYGSRPPPALDGLTNCIVVADLEKITLDQDSLAAIGENVCAIVFGDAELAIHPLGANFYKALSCANDFPAIGILAAPADHIKKGKDQRLLEWFTSTIFPSEADPFATLISNQEVCTVIAEERQVRSSVTVPAADTTFDYQAEYLDELSRDVDRNRDLLEIIRAEADNVGRVVFFATTAEHARVFSGLLALNGIPAEAISEGISRERRQIAIQKFNAQECRVLCVHGFFVPGDAIRELSSAVIAIPTRSSVSFFSRLGRIAAARDIRSPLLRVIVASDSKFDIALPLNTIQTWNNLEKQEPI